MEIENNQMKKKIVCTNTSVNVIDETLVKGEEKKLKRKLQLTIVVTIVHFQERKIHLNTGIVLHFKNFYRQAQTYTHTRRLICNARSNAF